MSRLYFGSLSKSLPAVGVIMAGGSGERFWPLSRKSRPKQFLSLTPGGRSLIQETSDRLEPVATAEGIMVVTSAAQSDLVREHLPEAAILAEPMPKNTAPCLAFAAKKILDEAGDIPMLCVPADHYISDPRGLHLSFRRALELAKSTDSLVTIGVVPTTPETGFGYIRRGAGLDQGGIPKVFQVERFVEKPNRADAQAYLDSGEYFWNSGMFAWRPSVFLKAVRENLPALYAAIEESAKHFGSAKEMESIGEIFEKIDPISVDYGIMERVRNAVVVEGADFPWSDVGSWNAWMECAPGEDSEPSGTMLIDSPGSRVVRSADVSGSGERFIACIGLEDVVVVETRDAILVCRRDKSQDVKKVVEFLKGQKRADLL